MAKEISIESIGRGIADVKKDFTLYEKPMSRLIFHAQIHKKGIRGYIIRKRKTTNGNFWISDKKIDIRDLKESESINVELPTEAVEQLYLAIQQLGKILEDRGVEYGKHSYTIVDPSKVIITEKNKSEYIKKLLDEGFSEDMWKDLVEQNPSLATKLSYARIQVERKKVVEELELRLKSQDNSKIQETIGDNSWQKWIYENNWLFGVNYKEPIEKTKVNIRGIMPDYLFPTIDGFADILEIKLPDDEVIIEGKSHHGAWKWTPKANEAIGQVVNYIGEIDRSRLEIEKNIKEKYVHEISLLKPRGYILIGDSFLWSNKKKEGLRKMNHALHGIEVLTYKDLLDRGKSIIQLNSKNK